MNNIATFDPAAYTSESRSRWDETADKYEALSNAYFPHISDAFIEFSGLKRKWAVLDLACGPGLASRAAARAVGEKGSILATDLSPAMIARAKESPAPKRAAPIEWAVMDAQALTVPNNQFDAVICQLGLMLFAQPAKALNEMVRVTKKGGVVACLVQGRREKMLFTSLVLHALIECNPALKGPEGTPSLYAFGPDGALEAAFAGAGLREISTKRLSGTFRFSSTEDYWNTMTEGSGRTGALLRSLSEDDQAWVKKTVLRRAAKNKFGSGVLIPYEFMMARGFK